MLTVVADSNHDCFYILERRVTEHGDLVLRLARIVVVDDVRNGVAHTCVTCPFGFVARCFGVGQHREREIKHVLFGPHFESVGLGVVVVEPFRRQHERNLVFVVVIAQVATHTDETGEVAVFEVRIDGTQLLGMDEHLQVLVLTHVVAGILVHSACIVRAKVHGTQYHRLFVLGNELRLSRVGLAAHTRR